MDAHWNYRVVRKELTIKANPTVKLYEFVIYEVYYDKDGIIEGWADGEARPFGNTKEELTSDIEHMKKALGLPVLEEKEIDGKEHLVEVEAATE